ncbi:MAG: rubredoxin [Candidatus Magnetominusculus sp. LBB02]|nr:rubredoxin [Candidatus Magnetominusculus sp. LBB02]
MCRGCGYIYNPDSPSKDDLVGGHAGVSFDDLPSGWVCPLCGLGKSEFVPW